MQDMRIGGTPDDDPVRRAYLGLGITPSRLEVLRVVFAAGETTAQQLMEELDLSRNAVGYHLKALTDQGLLRERRATHPRGSGPVIYWSADKDEVRDVFRTLYSHVSTDSF